MNVIDALNWRYAVREFSSEVISPEKLQNLLEATRLSPSSYGLQPYHLLIIQSPAVRQQLLEFSMGQDKIANCSHLIIFAAHTNVGDVTVDRYLQQFSTTHELELTQLQSMEEHYKAALAAMKTMQRQEWAHQQAYLALGNFLTCAALMEIDTCPMTGIERDCYDKVLGLREKNLTTTVACPIGIRHANDKRAQEKKVRFAQQDMITYI